MRGSGKVMRSALPRFEYASARSVREALGLVARSGGRASLLAGGTDLLVKMKMVRIAPAIVVDIKRVAALGGPIRETRGFIAIPPLATLAEIAESRLLARKVPVLPRTALLMASPQVRSRATVGGNLANAAPSADMAPPLMALGARVKVHAKAGARTVPLDEFFTGPGETVLGTRAVLGTILVPVPPASSKASYHPFTIREAMDLSVASAAAFVRRKGKRIVEARIVLGAVAPTPIRVPEAEALLVGTMGGPGDIEAAAEAAVRASRPITDVRATEEYRRDIVRVVATRAIREVLS